MKKIGVLCIVSICLCAGLIAMWGFSATPPFLVCVFKALFEVNENICKVIYNVKDSIVLLIIQGLMSLITPSNEALAVC